MGELSGKEKKLVTYKEQHQVENIKLSLVQIPNSRLKWSIWETLWTMNRVANSKEKHQHQQIWLMTLLRSWVLGSSSPPGSPCTGFVSHKCFTDCLATRTIVSFSPNFALCCVDPTFDFTLISTVLFYTWVRSISVSKCPCCCITPLTSLRMVSLLIFSPTQYCTFYTSVKSIAFHNCS